MTALEIHQLCSTTSAQPLQIARKISIADSRMRNQDYPRASQTLSELLCEVRRISERIEILSQNGIDTDGLQDANSKNRSAPQFSKSTSPDPRLIRLILRARKARAEFFDEELFGDPAWDMLLDLTAARAEHTRVSITSLCIASGVPSTTALRWIGQMIDAGIFERVTDADDRRRSYISLTDKAAIAMSKYFEKVREIIPSA